MLGPQIGGDRPGLSFGSPAVIAKHHVFGAQGVMLHAESHGFFLFCFALQPKVRWLNLHPPKQTWNLKMDPWKRRFLLETIISRFHVNFRGCSRFSIQISCFISLSCQTFPSCSPTANVIQTFKPGFTSWRGGPSINKKLATMKMPNLGE